MKHRTKRISLGAAAILLALPFLAAAQSADELAKQTQNPVASLISVPLQGNCDFGLGDRDAVGTLLNIQPVMPFAISDSTNVILRVIMPLTSQPGFGDDRINGVGDIVTTAFFSPAKSGRIIWGVGPVFLLPAATNNALGSEQFGLGPSVVALAQPGQWTVGALYNQIWSVSGANDRDDVNSMFLQPFAKLQPRWRTRGRSHSGSHCELGGRAGMDRTPRLQCQQGSAAWQAACQLRGGRRSDHREPRRRRRLAIPAGSDVPVSTVMEEMKFGRESPQALCAWVILPVARLLGALAQSAARYPHIKPGQEFPGYK
jgi:hypothetical protein